MKQERRNSRWELKGKRDQEDETAKRREAKSSPERDRQDQRAAVLGA